jgi:hypothetical protein
MTYWKEIKGKDVRVFQFKDEPEIFYIIPSREDEYMIVHDDAWEINTGKVEYLNSSEIKSKYGITL